MTLIVVFDFCTVGSKMQTVFLDNAVLENPIQFIRMIFYEIEPAVATSGIFSHTNSCFSWFPKTHGLLLKIFCLLSDISISSSCRSPLLFLAERTTQLIFDCMYAYTIHTSTFLLVLLPSAVFHFC